jgi:citrate synthase
MVHEQLVKFYQGFRRDAHPMAVMVGVVGALSAFYHDAMDFSDPEHRRHLVQPPDRQDADHRRDGLQVQHRPALHVSAQRPRLHRQLHAHDVRHAVRGVQAESGAGACARHASSRCTPTTSRTPRPRPCAWPVRRCQPFACIAAGIACLWGPAHGGANEACLQMLEEIGDVSRVGEYIKRAKDKNDSFKLMGFGHRVYKNFDPRAKLMRKVCADVLGELGLENDRLFKLAMELERSRWKTRTSSRRSSTRTSTSTRASCRRRSASRPRCSPASSRWPAPSAG